jgi:Tol biopolymer transport system component
LAERYTLERELGRGGMATVFLAQDLKHGRSVAFKLLRPDLAAIVGTERFLREIQLTATLQHPHILPLLDSGATDGFLYYVMPYVEGESLRQRLARDSQLPLDEALGIARGVASALDYAHGQGVIHRDIKPENILLYRGEPMVADFGIALAASAAGKERLTETGLSLGTPAYMSPEQASATARLDGRSDQYSLACVVYEMLAGEPPYTGATAQAIIAKRFSEPIPRLSTLRAVPAGVEAAVTRGLAKSPADRFSSVGAFAAVLERPQARRGLGPRTVAISTGIAVLIAVALMAPMFRPHRPAGPAVSRQFTFTGRATEPVLSPDGKWVAYVADSKSLLVQRLDGGEPVMLVPASRWLFHPRWTGDGTALLFCWMPDSSRLAATWMVPSVGGSPHEVLPDIDAFDAGPDSTTALWSQREKHRIEVVDLRTHEARQVLRIADSLDIIDDVSWSPDRRWVVLQAKGGIWLASLAVGALRQLAPVGWQPRWSPSGDAIYFLSGPRGTTALMRVAVDPRTSEVRGAASPVVSLPTADRFSIGPAGVMTHTQVASSSQALAIQYSSSLPRRIEETRALTEGTGLVNTVSITDDGERVAVSRRRGGKSSLEVVSFGGGAARILRDTPSEELGPSWSPDGTRLAFVRLDSAGGRLLVANYPEGNVQRLGSTIPDWQSLTRTADEGLLPMLGSFVSAFWSGNGQWLSYPAADLRRIGVVRLGDQTESFVPIPDSLGAAYIGVGLLSPDGDQMTVSTVHRWNDWGELWLASRDGRSWRRLEGPFGESYPLRWTEDGHLYILNCRAYSRMEGSAACSCGGYPCPGGSQSSWLRSPMAASPSPSRGTAGGQFARTTCGSRISS